MPVPPHYNWLMIQTDFDRFRNSLRSHYFLSTKEEISNSNVRNNNEVNNPSTQISNWSASKTNSPELQAFLTSAERDLFSYNKLNDVKYNLSEIEISNLKN